MRIAIGGISHETHTFLPGTTGLERFMQSYRRGQQIPDAFRATNTSMGGMVRVCEQHGVEILPTVYASGGVSGVVEDAVYDQIIGEMCERLAHEADSLDGVLLSLHGAMVTETRQDTETHILNDVRRAVGYDLPVMVALDLHANLDPSLLTKATAVFGYRSSPHVDAGETGERAASAMLDALAGNTVPVCAMKRPQLVIPSLFSATTVYPANRIIQRVMQWQEKPRVIDVSFFFGFAWSDVHQLGASAVAVTHDAPELAQVIVQDLSDMAWSMKEDLTSGDNIYSVEEGVAIAIEKARTAKKPVLLLDHADRLNDTTFVLRELIKQGAPNCAVPLLYDPEAAALLSEAGKGSKVRLAVGSKSSPDAGGPVMLEGTVEWVGQKTYTGTGPMTKGQKLTDGLTAIVRSGQIWVQIVSRMSSLIDEDPFIQYGSRLDDFRIVVSKSKTHFRAVYEQAAEHIIVVDAPMYSPINLSAFNYRNVPRGVYPITRK